MIKIYVKNSALKAYKWTSPSSTNKCKNENELRYKILRHYLLGTVIFQDKFDNHWVQYENLKIKATKTDIYDIERVKTNIKYKVSELEKDQFDNNYKDEILSVLEEHIS